MCLSTITALPKSTSKHHVGYKVCKITPGVALTPGVVFNLKVMTNIYFTSAVGEIELGKWYQANRDTQVYVDTWDQGLSNVYMSGFHVYESLEAAKRDFLQWHNLRRSSYIKYVIVKCTCKFVRVVGTQRMTIYDPVKPIYMYYQDTVMVADWLRYDEVLNAEV